MKKINISHFSGGGCYSNTICTTLVVCVRIFIYFFIDINININISIYIYIITLDFCAIF